MTELARRALGSVEATVCGDGGHNLLICVPRSAAGVGANICGSSGQQLRKFGPPSTGIWMIGVVMYRGWDLCHHLRRFALNSAEIAAILFESRSQHLQIWGPSSAKIATTLSSEIEASICGG